MVSSAIWTSENIKGNAQNKNTRNTTALTSRSLSFTFSFKNFKFILIKSF